LRVDVPITYTGPQEDRKEEKKIFSRSREVKKRKKKSIQTEKGEEI